MIPGTTWAPVIPCENCDDYNAAEFVLPCIDGSVSLLCHSHAQDWYGPEGKHLLAGARKLEHLGMKDMEWLTNEEED